MLLKVWGELTFRQIARPSKCRRPLAASRYRYALEHLRTLFKEARMNDDEPLSDLEQRLHAWQSRRVCRPICARDCMRTGPAHAPRERRWPRPALASA